MTSVTSGDEKPQRAQKIPISYYFNRNNTGATSSCVRKRIGYPGASDESKTRPRGQMETQQDAELIE